MSKCNHAPKMSRKLETSTTHLSTFTTDLLGSNYLNLNIGGEKFLLKWSNISKLPESRLCKILHASNLEEIADLCDEVSIQRQEIYFDRSARNFRDIADFYYCTSLHLNMTICILSFYNELVFWGLDNIEFDSCCSFKFHEMKRDIYDQINKMNELEEQFENSQSPIVFTGPFRQLKEKVWNIMENPETSNFAKAITIFSILFILLSTVTLVTSTMPSFKISSNTTNTNTNVTQIDEKDHPTFELIETICIIWFTFEFLLRFWASPQKLKFLKGPLNIIDIISILPFYLTIGISQLSSGMLQSTLSIRKLFTLFRVLRILRIFKLARHSKGLKAFGRTIQMSLNELGILFMFLGIAVLLFSSLAYFAEKDEINTQYTSIPATFWWAVITITTVGYGDMYPITFSGRIIGVFCCVGGILVLAMPIPIIVDNFRKICIEEQMTEKVLKYRLKKNEQKNLEYRL